MTATDPRGSAESRVPAWAEGDEALAVVALGDVRPDEYGGSVRFGLRVRGQVVRTSWEYPHADLLDVTTRLMRRWTDGSE